MKRGKQSKDAEPDAGADVDTDAAADSWTPADEQAVAPEPATQTWTAADERAAAPEPAEAGAPADAADPEPAVDSEAVELPAGAAPAREPAARPVPLTIIQPPVIHDPPAASANPIVDVSGAPSLTAPSFDGHATEPPSDPLQPVRVLAAERPELVVGAAFAGGIVAAMILRRLGN
jgi:hypothetical protein